MEEVTIKKPTKKELEKKGVFSWPIWEKEASRFRWFYEKEEHCYIIKGEVTVEAGNKKYHIKQGDYVIFPKGLRCIWDIKSHCQKHYEFGD